MFSKSTKTISLITAAFVAVSVFTSCADEDTPESEPSIPESSIEESVTETTEATTETTATMVYIYNGYYYLVDDQVIDGKTGLESMSISDAKKQGYADGSKQTDEDRYEYDYNLAYYMLEQGYSDEDIVFELINFGYCKNETAASIAIDWVKLDYENSIRTYPEPKDPIVVSFETDSGSGSESTSNTTESTSSGSGSSGSNDTGSGNSGNSGSGSTTTPTETTSSGSGSGTKPTETTSAPTTPTEPTSAPTEPTSAPTETTPAPTEAKTIQYYVLSGECIDEATGESYGYVTFTGSSLDDCINQFFNYCGENGYSPGGYGCVAVWSDGSTSYA